MAPRKKTTTKKSTTRKRTTKKAATTKAERGERHSQDGGRFGGIDQDRARQEEAC